MMSLKSFIKCVVYFIVGGIVAVVLLGTLLACVSLTAIKPFIVEQTCDVMDYERGGCLQKTFKIENRRLQAVDVTILCSYNVDPIKVLVPAGTRLEFLVSFTAPLVPYNLECKLVSFKEIR